MPPTLIHLPATMIIATLPATTITAPSYIAVPRCPPSPLQPLPPAHLKPLINGVIVGAIGQAKRLRRPVGGSGYTRQSSRRRSAQLCIKAIVGANHVSHVNQIIPRLIPINQLINFSKGDFLSLCSASRHFASWRSANIDGVKFHALMCRTAALRAVCVA